jgi:hypothetical protein
MHVPGFVERFDLNPSSLPNQRRTDGEAAKPAIKGRRLLG